MSFAGDLPAEGSGLDYSDIGANQRKDAVQLPLSSSLNATVSGSLFGASRGLYDYIQLDNAQQQAQRDRQFNIDPTEDPGGAMIDPKEWQTKYPDLGLTFTPDMGTAQAQLLVNHKQDELYREYVIDHGPNTFGAKTARVLTDFAASAIDPVNIAAAFVPGVGETRAGLWAARYGKTIGRVMEGGVAGAAGMAALQPLDAAEASAFQDHYGPMDAFANVAFGTVLGGGLHAGFGKISDFFGKAAPETRDAALRGTVANLAEGRPVDVEPILATDGGLSAARGIGTVTEPGAVDSLPVINQRDFALATQEAQLKQDAAGLDEKLDAFPAREAAIPAEDPEAVARLREHQTIEQQMASEDLPPDVRKELGLARDKNLTDTTPEALAAKAQPTFDREALATERRGVQAQRDNTARMLDEVKSQRQRIAADTVLGPYARAAIDRARENSLDFAKGQEQGPVTGTPEASKAAAETVRAGHGDDHAAELADAEGRLQAYKAQGIVSDEEHTAFSDENTAAAEAAKTKTDAAAAAARCLFLHP